MSIPDQPTNPSDDENAPAPHEADDGSGSTEPANVPAEIWHPARGASAQLNRRRWGRVKRSWRIIKRVAWFMVSPQRLGPLFIPLTLWVLEQAISNAPWWVSLHQRF